MVSVFYEVRRDLSLRFFLITAKWHDTNTHLVLPLKLGPHAPELHIRAAGRADVVHDVNVDVIEHHDTPVSIG